LSFSGSTKDLDFGVFFSALRVVAGSGLWMSCVISHLLGQKVWQIQDERGKSEIRKEIGLVK